jgi:DNA-binding NtrC family response regulator
VVLSPESVLRLALTEMKQMTKAEPAVAACTLADAEREHILGVLKQTGGMIGGEAGAATRLGLPRTTLIYKMRKLGIEVRRANRSRPLQKTDGGESALFACAAAGGFRTDGLEAFA